MAGIRGPNIRSNVKHFIDITSQGCEVPRELLARELIAEINKMGEIPPSEETTVKMISQARNRKPCPQDQPWSLATLNEYPISAEALPYVLQTWIKAREDLKMVFTIRDAKWVSWLYMMFKEDMKQLVSTAVAYSKLEMVSEVFGETYDTFASDIKLFKRISGREINADQISKITEAGKSSFLSRQSLHKNKPIILEKERQLDQLKQSKPDLP